jgi:hypothetical protein
VLTAHVEVPPSKVAELRETRKVSAAASAAN